MRRLGGPTERRLIGCILLAAIGQGMALPFFFIYLTQVRHIDPGVVGLVGAWIGVAGLALGVPAGALVDRVGPRRVFIAVTVAYALGLMSYGVVTVPWQAFAAATGAALGGPALLGAYNTLLASATSEATRQQFFGIAFATLNLGIGIGGLIGGSIADLSSPRSFQYLYLLAGCLLIVGAMMVLTVRVATAPASSEVRIHQTGYREILADRVFRRFVLFAVILMACAYAQLEFAFPAFAVDVAHVSTRTVAWSLAANAGTIVILQLVIIARLEGRSRSRVLALVCAVIALSWIVLGSGAVASKLSPGLATAGVALCAVVFALGEVLMSPVMPAVTNALAPDNLRGRYNAVASMIFGLTAIVGPISAGLLIGRGLAAVWLGLVVAGLVIAMIMALSLRHLLNPQQDGRMAPHPAGSDVPRNA